MHKFHPLSIKKINKETSIAVSVYFDIPVSLSETFAFQAGQYITLRKTLNGEEIRRSYSIFTTPESGEMGVVIKALRGGTFSTYANDKLMAGDVLEVLPPEGKFIFSPKESNVHNYVSFAAGSGITPVLSILKSVLEKEPNSTFLLVYGNQNPQETIFLKQLMDLQKQYLGRFFLELVFSRTQENEAQFGRISTSIVNYFIKNKYTHLDFHSFYLCGPEEMIKEVTSVLKHNNVADKAIHFELFASTTESKTIEAADGNTAVTVILDDETSNFIIPKGKTVLEAVLEQDLDAPYSCQGGICSTCIARIKEGKAEMRKNQILTDGEIAEGLILTCQAVPTSAVLVVDYDDV